MVVYAQRHVATHTQFFSVNDSGIRLFCHRLLAQVEKGD